MGKKSSKKNGEKKKSNRMHPDDWSHQGDGDGDYSSYSSVGFLHHESDGPIATEWTKERSSQQMELDEMNHPSSRDDDDAGCCAVVMDRVVSCLHVLDLSIGISLLVYGSLMHTDTHHHFDASSSEEEENNGRAMAAISFCYIFGTIHLLTSVLGLYSRYVSTKCKRCGMYVSAYAGMYFAFGYYTIAMMLLIDTKGFLTYLDEHKEVMYFKSNVYEKTERMMPLIYSILIVLGSLEAMRLCILLGLRGRLVRHDAYDKPHIIPRRSSLSDANNNGGGALTEALLEQQSPSSATNNPFEDDYDDDVIGESGTVATGGGSVRSGRSGGAARRMETADTPRWWEKDIV